MPTTNERYLAAIGSRDLKHNARGTADIDVVGAVGMTGKHHELGVVAVRFAAGDNQAGERAVQLMVEKVIGRAWRASRQRLSKGTAQQIARTVLAWSRDGRCKPCDGLGFGKVPGAPALSSVACTHCNGSGRVSLAGAAGEHHAAAAWLAEELDHAVRLLGSCTRRKLHGE
jgi:hypothetical protein